MNARNLISACLCSGMAAASLVVTTAAYADEAERGLTRAEVVTAVRFAREHGTLVPAGEATQPMSARRDGPVATRAEVNAATVRAIRNGEMIAAGEGAPHLAYSGPSSLTRADRKAAVIRARAAGELIAAGEGALPSGRMASRTSAPSEPQRISAR